MGQRPNGILFFGYLIPKLSEEESEKYLDPEDEGQSFHDMDSEEVLNLYLKYKLGDDQKKEYDDLVIENFYLCECSDYECKLTINRLNLSSDWDDIQKLNIIELIPTQKEIDRINEVAKKLDIDISEGPAWRFTASY